MDRWLVLAVIVAVVALVAFIVIRRKAGAPQRSSPPKGRPHQTASGLWVRSLGERRVADALTRRDIAFEYEPKVLQFRPDFRIKHTRILIEYWGGAGHSDYAQHMLHKIERYEAAGWIVVSIFPIHLHELERVLDRELARAGLTWA